jgi:lipopolysaccharide export system ATP-binding protein
MTTAVLSARGLRKSFGGREVLRGVDVDVGAGEVVGLLGPNGAGKTTAFRVLIGFLRADGGEIAFGGRRIERLPVHERARLGLGYLPQSPSVIAGLSVSDNVQAILEERGHSDAEPRTKRALEQAGLARLSTQRAGTLSGGERRRLEIARLLSLEPRVVLFDEPFTGVDPLAAEDLRQRICRLRESGVGVLLTDHNVGETMRVCDRISLLVGGRVVCAGTPAEVRADAEAQRLYLGRGD